MHQNIMAVEPAGFLDYACYVGAALLVGALLTLVLWTPASRHRTRPSPAKAKCYRVQEIPIATTKADLLRRLAECLPGSGAHDAAGLRLTLAKSSNEYQTATFVSSVRPKSLGYPIDSSFIGITSLFEGDNATVE